MNLKYVKFSRNWNKKIFCDCFTTIRRPNPGYYILGNEYEIYLDSIPIKKCKLVDIQKGDPKTLSEQQARVDTGYDKAQTLEILKKMYGDLPPEIWVLTFLTVDQYPVPFKAKLLEAIEKFSETATGLGNNIKA